MTSVTVLTRAPWFKGLAFLIFVFICWNLGGNGFANMGAMGSEPKLADQPKETDGAFATKPRVGGSADWSKLPGMLLNLAINVLVNGVVLYVIIKKRSNRSMRVAPAVARVSNPARAKQELVEAFSSFGELYFTDYASGWLCRIEIDFAVRVVCNYTPTCIFSNIVTPSGPFLIDETTQHVPGPENRLSLSGTLAQKTARAAEVWFVSGSSI